MQGQREKNRNPNMGTNGCLRVQVGFACPDVCPSGNPIKIRTSPDQIHEGVSCGDGLNAALAMQPLLRALPRMNDGDHEDANEDCDDRGHHVVHSCPHPHPPCRLVVQGCHTWGTDSADPRILIHTPSPTLPSICSTSQTTSSTTTAPNIPSPYSPPQDPP